MSYSCMIYHIVFSTYRRTPNILTEHERELYAYFMGMINNLGAHLYRIGGMPDHIHIVVDIPPKISVSEFVQKIKRSSSFWLGENNNFPGWEKCEEGYGVFTCSYSQKQKLIDYVKGQKEHHTKISFADEFRFFLEHSGIKIDERYMPAK